MLIITSAPDNLNCHLIADELAASERLAQLLDKSFLLRSGIICTFVDHMPEVIAHGESWEAELSLDELAVGTFADSGGAKEDKVALSTCCSGAEKSAGPTDRHFFD